MFVLFESLSAMLFTVNSKSLFICSCFHAKLVKISRNRTFWRGTHIWCPRTENSLKLESQNKFMFENPILRYNVFVYYPFTDLHLSQHPATYWYYRLGVQHSEVLSVIVLKSLFSGQAQHQKNPHLTRTETTRVKLFGIIINQLIGLVINRIKQQRNFTGRCGLEHESSFQVLPTIHLQIFCSQRIVSSYILHHGHSMAPIQSGSDTPNNSITCPLILTNVLIQ